MRKTTHGLWCVELQKMVIYLAILEVSIQSPKVGLESPILMEFSIFATSHTCVSDIQKTRIRLTCFYFEARIIGLLILEFDSI